MTGTHPEEQREQPGRISPIVIIAGALASLSAAVVASYFGVAGTFIGTAVVSIVSSLAAALYAGLLGRTRGLVQRTTTVLRAPTPHPEDRDARASAEAPGERGPSGGPGEGEASDHRRGGGLAGLPWRRSALVVGVAVLIFAIAIGAVTGIEAAIKEPIAAALGVRDKGQARTSVGVAVNRASGPATTQSPGPSSPSPSTQPQAPTSSQPGQAPPTTQPSQPGPSTTGGTQPPTTAPPTTAQPSSPSTSGGTSASR